MILTNPQICNGGQETEHVRIDRAHFRVHFRVQCQMSWELCRGSLCGGPRGAFCTGILNFREHFRGHLRVHSCVHFCEQRVCGSICAVCVLCAVLKWANCGTTQKKRSMTKCRQYVPKKSENLKRCPELPASIFLGHYLDFLLPRESACWFCLAALSKHARYNHKWWAQTCRGASSKLKTTFFLNPHSASLNRMQL